MDGLTWWSAAKERAEKERKKWFELSHIRENHPQNGYAREYNESKAWCFEQIMQDCYIKSIDGLNFCMCIISARSCEADRHDCHGYRGSRFGVVVYGENICMRHPSVMSCLSSIAAAVTARENITLLEQRNNGMCSMGGIYG